MNMRQQKMMKKFLDTNIRKNIVTRNFSSSGSNEALEKELSSLKSVVSRQNEILSMLLQSLQIETTNESKAANGEAKEKSFVIGKKNPRGFVDFKRKAEPYRSSKLRLRDWAEINILPKDHPVAALQKQASRCMDCGTPFCQTHTGCPINNLIPEWNALVLQGQFYEAYKRLAKTNNFPEFTGRVCPAPCEGACVAGIVDEDQAVTIKNIEYKIIDNAFENGWVQPRIVQNRSHKKVAVVGSGPAGLACADQLNQMGHTVTVYEREDTIGGLMHYGIPNMKIDKRQVSRRIDVLAKEGIIFKPSSHIGVNIDAKMLETEFDAIALCLGATVPRKLGVKGGDLKGVHFAMEFLTANQKTLKVESHDGKEVFKSTSEPNITAEGKNVVVIGGGDTGTDCIGTALRQYCKNLINLELLSKRPKNREQKDNYWPLYPKVYKLDYGHDEAKSLFGDDPRKFSVKTVELVGNHNGEVTGVKTILMEGNKEVPGSERIIPADLVLLAMGFLGPENNLIQKFGLKTDERSNIDAKYGVYRTSKDHIFAGGDCRRGQSLVVWAINEGRGVADAVDNYFKNVKK